VRDLTPRSPFGLYSFFAPEGEGSRARSEVESMPIQHHPVFSRLRPFSGVVPRGHEYDFMGTITHPLFLGREGAGEMVPVTTGYLYPDEEYFEWIDLLEPISLAGQEYTMIEACARLGRWAVRAAFAAIQQGKNPRIIAVEAEPVHFQWLSTHFRNNSLDPAAYNLVHAAVTNQLGDIPLYVEAPPGDTPDRWYGQCVVNDYDHLEEVEQREYMGLPIQRHLSGWKSIAVPGITLQTLISDCKSVDLIDMDIQGHELAVVAGAIEALDEKVKCLHIGTHSPQIEVGLSELMKAQGYPWSSESDTPWGRLSFQDGVQSWMNPRLH
jgi:FkbM family methyltransferase